MDNLSFNNLGIHFNNAIVMSEEQFQIMMDYFNDLKSQLTTIQLEMRHGYNYPEHKNVSELPKKKESKTEAGEMALDQVVDKYKDKIKYKEGKKSPYLAYVYNQETKKARPITARSKDELFEKLLKIENGEMPAKHYKTKSAKPREIKTTSEQPKQKKKSKSENDFDSWKVYWKETLTEAIGKPPFQPVFDKMLKIYGTNVYEEAKRQKYKRSEVMECIYYTKDLKTLFESQAKSFLEKDKPKKHSNNVVEVVEFNPDKYGNELARITKGKKGTSSIYLTMKHKYGVDWPIKCNTMEKRAELLMRNKELRDYFMKSYDDLKKGVI